MSRGNTMYKYKSHLQVGDVLVRKTGEEVPICGFRNESFPTTDVRGIRRISCDNKFIDFGGFAIPASRIHFHFETDDQGRVRVVCQEN